MFQKKKNSTTFAELMNVSLSCIQTCLSLLRCVATDHKSVAISDDRPSHMWGHLLGMDGIWDSDGSGIIVGLAVDEPLDVVPFPFLNNDDTINPIPLSSPLMANNTEMDVRGGATVP